MAVDDFTYFYPYNDDIEGQTRRATVLEPNQLLEDTKFLGKINGAIALVAVGVFQRNFPTAKPLVALYSACCGIVYMAASFDTSSNLIANYPEGDGVLKKLNFHQRLQSFFYFMGAACILSKAILNPEVFMISTYYGPICILAGAGNSFLFN